MKTEEEISKHLELIKHTPRLTKEGGAYFSGWELALEWVLDKVKA